VTLPLVLVACGEGKRPPSPEARSVTARFSITQFPDPQEGAEAVATFEGIGDFTKSQVLFTLIDLSGKPLYERLQIGPVTYTKAVRGRKWRKNETEEPGAAAIRKVRDGLVSSQRPLSYLRSVAEDVKLVGSDIVRGKNTTHYTATVDLGKEGGTPGRMFPVEVWIDESDRVVRYQHNSFGSRETFRWEFYDYGVMVNLTPPPDRETLGGG